MMCIHMARFLCMSVKGREIFRFKNTFPSVFDILVEREVARSLDHLFIFFFFATINRLGQESESIFFVIVL